MSRAAARKALEKRLKTGGEWYGPVPETLALSEIKTLEDVFQYRSPEPRESTAHVRKLARCVAVRKGPLGRLKVFWVGDAWVCIDGHHRLKAYRSKGTERVPVDVFSGTLKQAVTEALKANNQDQLQRSEKEKTAAAWALVTTWGNEMSKAEIAELAGVGTTIVAVMRKALKTITEEHPRSDPSDLKWWQARDLAAGKEEGAGGGREEAHQALVEKMRKALVVTFKDSLSKNPLAFADALSLYHENLPGYLREAFEQRESEAVSAGTEEAGGVPFKADF